MPASLIAPLLVDAGWSAFAVSASTFAIRLVTSFAISELINKPPAAPPPTGSEIQLPPYTDNKVPVVYGSAFISPIITDIILSQDQQTIWYVLTFSEVTSGGAVTFDEVWYNGKLMVFDENNPNEIIGLWTRPKKRSKLGGSIELGPSGSIGMYFYGNGIDPGTIHTTWSISSSNGYVTTATDSLGLTTIDAVSLLQNSGLDPSVQWTASDKMNNAAFAVLRLNYNPNNGVTGLGQIIAKVRNPLNDPGLVILDYLTNDVYGCAVPLQNVNTASLALVSEIAQNPKEITLTDGTTGTVTLQINGVLDTTQDCLSNLNNLTLAVDGWIQWDERLGQWGVLLNQSVEEQYGGSIPLTNIVTSDQIIGGVNLVPTDLQTSPNKITISFPNQDIIGQTDYRYYWLENDKKSPNEPENNIDINYPFVNTSTQATYLGYRKLWMGRQDLIINFSMDYSGIQYNAGDVIAVNHEWYGWTASTYNSLVSPGKPFRITQIKESKDDKGFLSVQITAQSHNESSYFLSNPAFYTPDQFGVSTLTNYLSTTFQPQFSSINTSSGVYVVNSQVPDYGVANSMEFWYSMTTSTIQADTFTLYSTQYHNPNGAYPAGYVENTLAVSLPAGTYWWATRAVGQNLVSQFSTVSDPLTWTGPSISNSTIDGANILDGSISGSKIVQGNPTSSPSSNKSFWNTLGEVSALSLGAAALYVGYNNGWFNSLLPKNLQSGGLGGAGNDGGDLPIAPPDGGPPLVPKQVAGDGSLQDISGNPQQGQQIVMVADATPPLPPVTDNLNFQGYDGVNPSDSGSTFS